jgi:hypothetical protein
VRRCIPAGVVVGGYHRLAALIRMWGASTGNALVHRVPRDHAPRNLHPALVLRRGRHRLPPAVHVVARLRRQYRAVRLGLATTHSPLDRHKPLWEVHVIDGLGDGRLAIYSKIPRALIDGLSRIRLVWQSFSMTVDDVALAIAAGVTCWLAPGPRRAAEAVPRRLETCRPGRCFRWGSWSPFRS